VTASATRAPGATRAAGATRAPLLRVESRRVDVLDRSGRRLARVDLSQVLWLTEAEQAVLTRGPLDAGAGIGAVLLPLLTHAARRDGEWRDGARPDGAPPDGLERRQVAAIIRDLLSAAAAELLDAETTGGAVSDDITPQQRLVVRALQIIHSRIDQPSLTSATVAAGLGVSVRSLQGAFRASSTSVTHTIRALRLERAQLATAAPRPVVRLLPEPRQ
jgi:AraC-like DNA-binding protein